LRSRGCDERDDDVAVICGTSRCHSLAGAGSCTDSDVTARSQGCERMAMRLRTCNGGDDDGVVCPHPDVFVLPCIHSLSLKGEWGWGAYRRVLLRAPAPVTLTSILLPAAIRLSLPAPVLVCVCARPRSFGLAGCSIGLVTYIVSIRIVELFTFIWVYNLKCQW
jgi:hypothetical protein